MMADKRPVVEIVPCPELPESVESVLLFVDDEVLKLTHPAEAGSGAQVTDMTGEDAG